MKNDINIYECKKCKSLIYKIIDCNCENCGINCCGEKMSNVNISTEGNPEKHIPIYTNVEDEIVVNVGKEEHSMEKDHYIMWVALVKDNKICKVDLYPEQDTTVRFKYISGSTIYAYCNKHGLWKNEVE